MAECRRNGEKRIQMDADSLFGGGLPAVKFPELGTTVTGVITRVSEPRPVTDPATGEVKRWPSGDEQMQILVDLDTDERNSEIEDDDGSRTLYCKGMILKAVKEAVRAKRVPGLRNGGKLTIQFHAEEPAKTKGFNPTKLYRAKYDPPVMSDAAWEDEKPAKTEKVSASKAGPKDEGPDW